MKNLVIKDNIQDFEYCRQLTAKYSKSFYLSTRLLPRKKQWGTFALYGFCRYADNLIDKPRNRSNQEILGEVKFLNRELRIAYRTGESEHPILSAFIKTARHYDIPREYPRDLLRGVIMDVQKNRYQNFDELYTFCYRVAGVVGLMMTHLLGYRDQEAFYYAEMLGIAMQLTNILRDIQEDKNMGRIYLPLDEIQDFGISEEEILGEYWSTRMHTFMKFQVERAFDYYQKAKPGIAMLDTDSRFAIHSASRIYRSILLKLREQNYNPFLGRVFVPQSQKMNILLREAMRTKIQTANEKLGFASSHLNILL